MPRNAEARAPRFGGRAVRRAAAFALLGCGVLASARAGEAQEPARVTVNVIGKREVVVRVSAGEGTMRSPCNPRERDVLFQAKVTPPRTLTLPSGAAWFCADHSSPSFERDFHDAVTAHRCIPTPRRLCLGDSASNTRLTVDTDRD